ncbi:zinc metalloproteinase nas-13-like [Lingula anatina]|uniref:Metalloendopeptidase n=1 Tax=Lingula anatina TaxID=7574 RepID=A0A1S3IN15_LINAN|nr:zinc metalloproteinase nas-13-like [Lingula anatina]|eukprot:XP_013399291.2 zinc metalloproteinase nas-13-like [Lingula anatina]
MLICQDLLSQSFIMWSWWSVQATSKMKAFLMVLVFSMASHAVAVPILQVAEAFADDRPEYEISPEEAGGKFEGDMDIEADIFTDPINKIQHRNALSSTSTRWPNGQVPFVISSWYTSWQKSLITSAMREIEEKTQVGSIKCIRFVNRSSELEYISIIPDSGCYSEVGRNSRGGSQALSLASGCLYKGIIMHELLHALGFYHEQRRADRENYVTIHWDNIEFGRWSIAVAIQIRHIVNGC